MGLHLTTPPSPAEAPGDPAAVHRPQRRPWVTYGYAALLVAMFVLEAVIGRVPGGGINGGVTTPALILLGAKVPQLIENGEYWRLVTANFLHGSWFHLALNVLVIVVFGSLVEVFYGRWRYLVIIVLAGVGGASTSYLFNAEISVGASTAVMGLIAAIVVHNLKYRAYLPPELHERLRPLIPLLMLEIIMGELIPVIDNYAHIGGMLTGAALGLLMEGRIAGPEQSEREWLPLPAGLATAVGLLAYGIIGVGAYAVQHPSLARASIAQRGGQWNAVVASYSDVLRQHPEIWRLRLELAQALDNAKRYDEAEVVLLAKRDRALNATEQTELLAYLVISANDLHLQRKGEAAERRLRAALPLALTPPQRALVQNGLAYLLADVLQRNLDEAEQLVNEALIVDPENSAYLDTLAWVLYRKKEYAQALPIQERAAKAPMPPDSLWGLFLPAKPAGEVSAETRYHLGAIREALGNTDEARRDYEAALEIDPKFEAAKQALERLKNPGVSPPPAILSNPDSV